jgi:hypothetical protein
VKRILFVDEQERVLHELERALSPLSDRWEMRFLPSEEEAASAIEAGVVDVLVGDDGEQGLGTLALASKKCATTVRLMLLPEDHPPVPAAPAHQIVPRPCSQTVLATSIARACALHNLLTDPRLTRLVARLEHRPDAELLHVALSDPARDAESLRRAWLSTIEELEARLPTWFRLDERRVHATEVSRCAGLILATERSSAQAREEGQVAGLLHDLGELVLAANLPERFRAVRALAERDDADQTRLETRAFGASHAALGAYLLGLAGHSTAIVEAVAFHHRPSQWSDTLFGPLAAVHAANVLVALGEKPSAPEMPGLDRVFLRRIGLEGRLPAWAELCRPTPAD